MKMVGLYEAKTTLSALVAELERTGRAIALTRHGKVVAELQLPQKQTAPKAGMLATESFFMADDFDADTAGFEELLAEDDLPPRLQKVADDEARGQDRPKSS